MLKALNRLNRRSRFGLVVLVLLVLPAVVSVIFMRAAAVAQLELARARLAESGEPMGVRDVQWPEHERDAMPWFQRMGAALEACVGEGHGELHFFSPSAVDYVAAPDRSGISWPRDFGKRSAATAWPEFHRILQGIWFDQSPQSEVFATLLNGCTTLQGISHAEHYRLWSPENPLRFCHHASLYGPMPAPNLGLFNDALILALRAAVRGDTADLFEAFLHVQHMVRLAWTSGVPDWQRWGSFGHRAALELLSFELLKAPLGADSTALMDLLSTLDERASLVQTFIFQRALGLDYYALPQKERILIPLESLREHMLGASGKETEFLLLYEELLSILRTPWTQDSRRTLESMHAPGRWAQSASASSIRMARRVEHAWQGDALRTLALVALTAYADGLDEAESAAATLADPYAQGGIRSRREADGSLVLWSVGRNGVDDSASLDDLVWKVQAR